MKIRNALLLLLTATIWGVAFVAQSVGMDYVGPFTFLCARSLIGGVVLLPLVAATCKSGAPAGQTAKEKRAARHYLVVGGIACGVMLCAASSLQQFGLLYTTVGKAGFLTACYILIVPLLSIPLGQRCGRLVWFAVAIALVGLYFLCLTDGFSLSLGDGYVLLCALMFSLHILVVAHFSPHANGIALSCIQFFTCGVLSGILMLIFEEPSWGALIAAWKPVLYAGMLSSGVGYTLQVVAQKGVNPTVASLLMSMESVVSVLAGWIILRQALTGREIFGCVLMFIAIVLAQLPEDILQKHAK